MAYLSPLETEEGTVSDTSEIEEGTTDISETEEGTTDTSETEEDSRSEDTANAEDTVSDDDRPQQMTYQFHNCQTIIMNAFNARGVKYENAGNNAPQVTCMSFLIFFLAISVLIKSVLPMPSSPSSSDSSASSVSTFPVHKHRT